MKTCTCIDKSEHRFGWASCEWQTARVVSKFALHFVIHPSLIFTDHTVESSVLQVAIS